MRYLNKESKIVTDEDIIDFPIRVAIPAKDTESSLTSEIQLFPTRIGNLSSAQKDQVKLTAIIDEPRPDDRFYFVNEDPVRPGKWVTIPRDLNDLKAAFTAQVQQTAAAILNQTDWMVTRSIETGTLDQKIKDYRASVRTYSNTLEDAIDDAKDIAALQAVMSGANAWPEQEV